MTKPKYSIVLPIRNEDASLPELFSEIQRAMDDRSYEIIAVDDASGYHHHFGKWEALRVGIAHAKGDVVITMDADLQDDPKELPRLITKLKQGYDIVSGWRKNRQDPWYKVHLSRFANVWIGAFHDFASPYKAYRKNILLSLPQDDSLLRYTLLFAKRKNYRIAEIPVAHHPRTHGTSNFGLIKYVQILYDLILIGPLFNHEP